MMDAIMLVRFRTFRGRFSGWNALFAEAATAASGIPPDRLISISHSADGGEGVVTVWYWATDAEEQAWSG